MGRLHNNPHQISINWSKGFRHSLDSVQIYLSLYYSKGDLNGAQLNAYLHYGAGLTLSLYTESHRINRVGPDDCDQSMKAMCCREQRAADNPPAPEMTREKWPHQWWHREMHCTHPSMWLKSSFKQTMKSISVPQFEEMGRGMEGQTLNYRQRERRTETYREHRSVSEIQ